MDHEHVEHDPRPETDHAEPVYEGPSSEERNWALFAHIGPILLTSVTGILGLVAPLVIWLVKKDESEFVDDQGKEALNFQITVLIALMISGLLVCVGGIGLLFLIPIALGSFVLSIVAGIKAASGEYYRYPLTMRFLS